jgi:hypothetical protein
MTGSNQKPKGASPKTSSVEDQLSRLRAALGVSERTPSSDHKGSNEVDDRDEITRQIEARLEKLDRQLSTRLTVDDLRLLADLEDALRPIIDEIDFRNARKLQERDD